MMSIVCKTHRTQKTVRPGVLPTTVTDYHNKLQVHRKRSMLFLNMKLGHRKVRIRPRDAPLQHTAQVRTIARLDSRLARPHVHHTTQSHSAQPAHHHPCTRSRPSCAR